MGLQDLRDYVFERHGILEEGWHVEFKLSPSCGDLHPVYCSPDGKTFDSMSEVACYLDLVPYSNHIVPEVRYRGSASRQRTLHLSKRRKSARHTAASGVTESKETLMSGLDKEQSADFETVGSVVKSGNSIELMETGPEESYGSESQQYNDWLPVQYEDFFVLSLGKIDARASYHNANHIWPLGYRSCWHDKVTGSLFICDVSDGGDSGPVFKIRRCSCSALPIPKGSTVLCRPKLGQSNHQKKGNNGDMTSRNMDYDDDFSVMMILSDPSPPTEHDILTCIGSSSSKSFNIQKANGLQLKASPSSERSRDLFSDNPVLRDEIGEFLIEESSSSSAWTMVSRKLIDACREIYMHTGTLKFFCNHVVHGTCSPYWESSYGKDKEKFISLAKLCASSDAVNIPSIIQCDSEFETSSEELVKWLDQDRFGLDVEFVQEIVERLPGAQACSQYKVLNERSSFSSSAIVGNGLLEVKTNGGDQAMDEEVLDGLFGTRKRAKIQMVDNRPINDRCLPPGRPLSSRLPPQLVGDVLQVWEFLLRFYEILGLKDPLSFEELEEELMSPWFDGPNLPEKFGCEVQDIPNLISSKTDDSSRKILPSTTESGPEVPVENRHSFIQMETEAMKEAARTRLASVTYKRCTGYALTKIHYSLLKVLVSELQSKVAAVLNQNFDIGELKSKRGRKKGTDCWIAAKRTKLNMLPLNELTWPELARRYILAVLSMNANLDSPEITIRESGKVFRCLQGDGGVLCGSLTGIVGIEADALLLAEATKKIFGSLNREKDLLTIDDEGPGGTSSCERVCVNDGNIPEWAQVLQPVRKLPTNVGARIRKCVYDALEKDPPEWAKKILEHSISKEVYKGNASGPTKRAVLSVLADVHGEGFQKKRDRESKRKKFISISEMIMKQCRIVLRRVAAADDAKVFCNLLGRKLINSGDNDDEGILGSPAMASRPLDFRTIDLRLAVGAYDGSHEAFVEDVRELWTNVRMAYVDQPDLVQLAETLSCNFEKLYEKEVVVLFQKLVEYSKLECLSPQSMKEIDDFLVSASKIPKAPWEEGVCKVCGIDRDDDSVLLCDTCDSEYHTYCLSPPLARIPEGNWYCPSCISGKCLVQDASESTPIICQNKKKFKGEIIHFYLDALTHLVAVMEEKEYWELSVHERTFLLKFLCDDLLNSALIRHHLEHSAEVSADLQQKLRSLSAEWKTLKYKEEILAAKVADVGKSSFQTVGVVGTVEGSAAAPRNNDKCVVQLHGLSDGAFPDDLHELEIEGQQKLTGPNILEKQRSVVNLERNNSDKSQLMGTMDAEDCSKDIQAVVDDSRLSGNLLAHMAYLENDKSSRQELLSSSPTKETSDLGRENPFLDNLGKFMGRDISTLHSSEDLQGLCAPLDARSTHLDEQLPPMEVNKSEPNNLELNSVRNEILPLQNSIASIETQLLKLPVRREFLGRDSVGRLYCVLAKSGTFPWVIVNGNVELQQKGKEMCHSFPENCSVLRNSAQCGIDNLGTHECSRASCPLNGLNASNSICFPWVSYQSDAEIKELVGCLKDNDPRERELKESILHWQKLRFQGSQQTENRDKEEPQMAFLRSTCSEKSTSSDCLSTKATNLLEAKYGPCLEPETIDFLKKRNRKAKATIEEKLYRCECLEPIWPCRHHCLSCHRTFFTDVELEGHDDGKCSSIPPAPEKSKGYSYNLKGKGMMKYETAREESTAGEVDIADASKRRRSEGLIRYQNDGLVCPFDFEDICSKFVVKNSNKELVKEIGLIGSNGIPSLVPSVSHSLNDPTLMLVSPQEDSGVEVGMHKNDEQLAFSLGNKMPTSAVHGGLSSDISPRRCTVIERSEVLKAEGPTLESLEQKDKKSALHYAQVTELGNCCVVPESSLRPLVGKRSHILQQLKINLLDMDAVLPEEALRGSKAHLERRWAWRGFVKAAETIYEMVQAVIILEDMIKTEYLRNMWWHWSSLSAAAKISTLSSLALRIYSLDAAIDYDKISFNYPLDPGSKSDQKQQPSSDIAQNNKLGRKSNKKRKEPEG